MRRINGLDYSYDPEALRRESEEMNREIQKYGMDVLFLRGGGKTVPIFSDSMGIMTYRRPDPAKVGDVVLWRWFDKLARGVIIRITTHFERTVYTVYSPDTGFLHEHLAFTAVIVLQPEDAATRAVMVAMAYREYRARLMTSAAWRERLSLTPEYSTDWSLFDDRRVS